MAIYLVTPLSRNAEQIGAAVRSKIADSDRHELQNNAGWLVSFSGTSVDLSNLLGFTSADAGAPSSLGSGMITSVGSYYGRGATTMWEWLKNKFEKL